MSNRKCFSATLAILELLVIFETEIGLETLTLGFGGAMARVVSAGPSDTSWYPIALDEIISSLQGH